MSARALVLRAGDRDYRATVADDGAVSIDGGPPMPAARAAAGEIRIGPQGRRAWTAASGANRWVFLDGHVFTFEVQDARRRRTTAGAHAPLASPMPATVVRVDAVTGARVRKGDTLVILEAMKMELPIRAAADGVVRAVHCSSGELVKPGIPLVEMDLETARAETDIP